MSTRCSIVVRGDKDLYKALGAASQEEMWMKDWGYLYHHCDGDEGGVGQELSQALSNYVNNEKSTFTIESVIGEITDISPEYERVQRIHSDVEYVYVINIDAGGKINEIWPNLKTDPCITITCYKTDLNKFNPNSTNFDCFDGYTKKYQEGMFGIFSDNRKLNLAPEDDNKIDIDFTKLNDEELNNLHLAIMSEIVSRNKNEMPDVTVLGDGCYSGMLHAHCFEYKGKQYYSSIGVKGIEPVPYTIKIVNGKQIHYNN